MCGVLHANCDVILLPQYNMRIVYYTQTEFVLCESETMKSYILGYPRLSVVTDVICPVGLSECR